MASTRRRRIRAYRARRANEAQYHRDVTAGIERINRFDQTLGEVMPSMIAIATCTLIAIVMLLA